MWQLVRSIRPCILPFPNFHPLSENILSLQAPLTSKCDFCQVYFCGISIPDRCVAAPLIAQHPHGFSDLGDLIQCGEVYECFDHNTVEVDIMLDYITAQGITPKHIYREVRVILSLLYSGFAHPLRYR